MMSAPEVQVFLDLEETVIESWDNPMLINIQKVRAFLKERHVTEVHIFSFAIHNDKDKADFERHLKHSLQEALGVTIAPVQTLDDFCRIIRQGRGGAVWEPFELAMVWGKFRSFVDVCTMSAPRGATCILIDDMVDDVSIKNFTKDVFIRTININSVAQFLNLGHDNFGDDDE
jgi:hypothetical protein